MSRNYSYLTRINAQNTPKNGENHERTPYYSHPTIIIGAITYNVAEKKGYHGGLATVIAGLLTLISIVGGIVTLIVYAVIPTKHIYCPNCGERNIHYLEFCRRCRTSLIPPDEPYPDPHAPRKSR